MPRTSTLIVTYATVAIAVRVAQPLPSTGLRGAPGLAAPIPGTEQATLDRELKFIVHSNDSVPPSSPEYMACLTDTEQDKYMEDWMTSKNMTSANCREHCTEAAPEHTYYATQYGSQCWCGDSETFADYDRHGPGNCTIECTGDSSEICGGEWSFSLFRIMDVGGGSGSNAIQRDVGIGSNGTAGMHSNGTAGMHSNGTGGMHSNGTAGMHSNGTVGIHSNGTAGMHSNRTPGMHSNGTMGMHSNGTVGLHPNATMGMHPNATRGDSANVTFGDMSELFDLHNAVRCMHGASPLSYSDEIAATAAAYAETLTNSSNCGAELEHSAEEDRNGWGENLYMCGSTELNDDCYSAGMAMFAMYDEEVANKEPSEYLEHATQILWNDTTAVGCAVDSCEKEGWRYNYLVCNYDPAGNILDEVEEQVAAQSMTRAACGYTESMVGRRK